MGVVVTPHTYPYVISSRASQLNGIAQFWTISGIHAVYNVAGIRFHRHVPVAGKAGAHAVGPEVPSVATAVNLLAEVLGFNHQ